MIPVDFKEKGPGYYPLDDPGGGYKVTSNLDVIFPVVYFVHTSGFIITCHCEYAEHNWARKVIKSGMAEILGRHIITRGKTYQLNWYFVCSFQIMSTSKDKVAHNYNIFVAAIIQWMMVAAQ